MRSSQPLRVLHVVGRMNPGGVETWLLNVFRNVDRRVVQFDLMVHHDPEGAYDREVEALGVRIFRNALTDPLSYWTRFRRITGSPPRYDVVHSHVHHFSGAVLALAALARVPARVAHSHNDTEVEDRSGGPSRQAYLRTMRWLVRRYATAGFACSAPAGKALFGTAWADDPRCRLLYCGIDPDAFAGPCDRAGVRAELGLPLDARLLLHVGRFDPQKNHSFLADVFRRVSASDPSTYLLLVGTGALEPDVRARFRTFGLLDRVRFCGRRSDVPRLLKASDVFVFPSLHEGLPLACLEAQAAGLPVVMSDRITSEVTIRADRVDMIPLGSVDAWADAVQHRLRSGTDPEAGAAAVAASRFSIDSSIAALLAAYQGTGAGRDLSVRGLRPAMRTAASDVRAQSAAGGGDL